jgi:hypothetical protein
MDNAAADGDRLFERGVGALEIAWVVVIPVVGDADGKRVV